MKTTTPRRSAPMKRHLSPTHEPSAKRMALSPTHSKRRMSPSPIVRSNATPKKGIIVSPKRIVIDEIPAAKLRSTELIRYII